MTNQNNLRIKNDKKILLDTCNDSSLVHSSILSKNISVRLLQ